ncbi:MAG: hypothetical protein ACLPSF_10860 [Methylocella sp.]
MGDGDQLTPRQAIGVPAQACDRGAIRSPKLDRGADRNRANVKRRIAQLQNLKAASQNKLHWGAGARTAKDLAETKRIRQEIARLQSREARGESIKTAW